MAPVQQSGLLENTLHVLKRASEPARPGRTAVLAVAAAFPALTIVVLAIRIFTRAKFKGGLKSDDWTALAAFVPAVAACILCITAITLSSNPSTSTEVLATFALRFDFTVGTSVQAISIYNILYVTSVTLVKISLMLLYMRLFAATVLRFWVCRVTIGLIFAWWVAFIVPTCLEYVAFSLPTTGLQYASQQWIVTVALGAIDVTLDIFVVVLPIPSLLHLNMRQGQRLQLVAIFSLAGFCIIASVVRLAYCSLALSTQLALPSGGRYDRAAYQAYAVNVFMWGLIEPCASIIATSLPTLRPLVSHLAGVGWIRRALSGLTLRHGARTSESEGTQTRTDSRWKHAVPVRLKKLSRSGRDNGGESSVGLPSYYLREQDPEAEVDMPHVAIENLIRQASEPALDLAGDLAEEPSWRPGRGPSRETIGREETQL